MSDKTESNIEAVLTQMSATLNRIESALATIRTISFVALDPDGQELINRKIAADIGDLEVQRLHRDIKNFEKEN